MLKRGTKALLWILLCGLCLSGCAAKDTDMQDGYYTAQAAEYSNGWKEFVTITVRGGKIISVEYNATNASGFIKSWDNAYMKNMKNVKGTYPNEYTRNYAAQLIQSQSPDVEAITGASTSAGSFDMLAAAVIEQAKKGDSQTVVVQTQ